MKPDLRGGRDPELNCDSPVKAAGLAPHANSKSVDHKLAAKVKCWRQDD